MESVIPATEIRRRSFAFRALAAGAVLFLAASSSKAEVVFNWGSPVFSTFRDSYGNPLDGSYAFELGAFDPSFTPDEFNVALWAGNWKVFDKADFNVFAETFASTADMLDNGTSASAFATPGYDFRGLDAYVWGYNTKSYTQTLEWVWFRAPSWTFPLSVAPGPPITPTDWSTSDLVAGDVPLWGRQSSAVGLGYASAPGISGDYTLQTYTLTPGPSPIPEPSTMVFAALLLAMAAWRRWKSTRTVAAGLFAAALIVAPGAKATPINFYSSPNQPGFGSDGQPLDENMSFELGVFANGFVPSATNTAQWAANWVPAQRAKFSRSRTWFTSVYTVTNNATPFLVGAPAYVWGFNGSEAQGQWILFRSTGWTWPKADDTAQTIFWSAKDANSIAVGSLPAAAGGVSLRSVAVANSVPPATKWNQWKLDNLTGQQLGNPADDADGDGIANIVEFISGTSPTSAADRPAGFNPTAQIGASGGKSYLEVRVPRRRDRPATFTPEISSDLASWTSGATAATELTNASDAATAVTLRDKTPIGEGGSQRFLRVKVSPQ